MQLNHELTDEPVQPDSRFEDLVGPEVWKTLPASVRRRFGKRLTGGASVVYQGMVVAMRMSLAGRLLSQLARVIGGPLPHDLSSIGRPAIVSVTEDLAGDGQFWIREYGRSDGFPQIIHSSKRFSGPTGIEEYIGCGLGIALTVQATGDGLKFVNDHYFLQIGKRQLRAPSWLNPGALTILHRDLGQGRFLFSLELRSRYFGVLVSQDAVFTDCTP